MDSLNSSDRAKKSQPEPLVRHLHLTPALVLAAQHESISISELVMVLRLNGLGGDRACRKLIHRLHRLNFLVIEVGKRDDRREKSVRISPETRKILAELRAYLESMQL
ncbi:MAG: hypothetical protein EBT64_00035 [Gammaproteobacteria bacterium]|nr:hypothetical protein [Gammaproteobacteria bacterium]